MKFSSATSITSTEELPAFQPKSGAGMSYGTRMHHMIEHLPNTSWDKEIITSCAKDLQISLKEYDITSLLQLGNHPFYQSLFSKTCYHELPFMVKIKDEILHGFMDFVAMDDTSMTIIDFKTDRLDTPEEFIKLYRSQLSSYQDAMRILYPDKTCETYIYAFHLRTFIQIK